MVTAERLPHDSEVNGRSPENVLWTSAMEFVEAGHWKADPLQDVITITVLELRTQV